MNANLKRIKIFYIIFSFMFCINAFSAIVSDNDNTALMTKAEFYQEKNSFKSKVDYYNNFIDSKIDDAIATYLARVTKLPTEDGANIHTFTDTNKVLNSKENISNKVLSITESANQTQYPSAKAVYDALGNKEEINTIVAGKGLKFGTGADANKLGHSNQIEPQTISTMGMLAFDSEGHITGFEERHLYLHTLRYQGLTGTANIGSSIMIYNDSDAQITYDDLKLFLQNNGYIDTNHLYSYVRGRANWATRYFASTSGGSPTQTAIINYQLAGIYYDSESNQIRAASLSPSKTGLEIYAIYPNSATSGWVLREDLEIIQKVY